VAEIQLVAVENIISRKKRRPRQILTFYIEIENLDFHKQVDVLWCDESGQWQTVAATFFAKLDERRERWQAQVVCEASAKQSLPGNIQFGLRLRCQGQEYWDNRHGENYRSEADSGYQLGDGIQIAHLGYQNRLQAGQKILELTVLIAQAFQAEQVTVHWTVDDWQSQRQNHCQTDRLYWDKHCASNARNPNQYGVQVWTTQLRCGQHFRLQYSISAQIAGQPVWDNNDGQNYCLSHKPLSLLILNLHCYQEQQQDEKFTTIARAIDEQEVDVVCFQEVAENWNEGQGDWESNAANIINQRLKKPFDLFYDWSHLGFDRYREGVAILSRYSLQQTEGRYVSSDKDPYSIHSRKVVAANIEIPYIGLVQVFSVHLSWWEDGFAEQFQHLHEWARQRQNKRMKATLLGGDFNIAAGSEGYRLVVQQYRYEDQFLLANQQGLSGEQFRVDDAYWRDYLADDYRIDYVFANAGHKLKVISARTLFTEQDYGRVSDHVGYLFTFEPLS
jgi:maltose 6'-phosphate phosphatase